MLEEDWRQALRDHQEQANTIFALRKDLRQGEALRARVRRGAGGTGQGPSQEGGRSAQLHVPTSPLLAARGPNSSPAPCLLHAPTPGPAGPTSGLGARRRRGPQAAGSAAVSRLLQCMEEKEMFELQCLALRKDSKMYKDRIEAVLQQMEEVAIERDQVGTSHQPPAQTPAGGGPRHRRGS